MFRKLRKAQLQEKVKSQINTIEVLENANNDKIVEINKLNDHVDLLNRTIKELRTDIASLDKRLNLSKEISKLESKMNNIIDEFVHDNDIQEFSVSVHLNDELGQSGKYFKKAMTIIKAE